MKIHRYCRHEDVFIPSKQLSRTRSNKLLTSCVSNSLRLLHTQRPDVQNVIRPNETNYTTKVHCSMSSCDEKCILTGGYFQSEC